MSSKQQPEWLQPSNAIDEPVLKVFNSLTRTKVTVYGATFLGVLANMSSILGFRCHLYLEKGATSNGIIVARLSTTWVTLGEPEDFS
jgi:hypothetical protein